MTNAMFSIGDRVVAWPASRNARGTVLTARSFDGQMEVSVLFDTPVDSPHGRLWSWTFCTEELGQLAALPKEMDDDSSNLIIGLGRRDGWVICTMNAQVDGCALWWSARKLGAPVTDTPNLEHAARFTRREAERIMRDFGENARAYLACDVYDMSRREVRVYRSDIDRMSPLWPM